MTREIPLTKGRVALVDDEDYEWLSQWKWSFCRGYAVRSKRNGPGNKQTFFFMHREIMRAPDEMCVDHRDSDGLNNQRSNLRLATPSENQHNRRKHAKPTTSQYKGVCRVKHRPGLWQVHIRANETFLHIGYYKTELDAARAYDRAALTHFGQFARLNFPDEATQ